MPPLAPVRVPPELAVDARRRRRARARRIAGDTAIAVVAFAATASAVLVVVGRSDPEAAGGPTPGTSAAPLPAPTRVKVVGLRNQPGRDPVLGWAPILTGPDQVVAVADAELVAFATEGGAERWRAPCPDSQDPLSEAFATDLLVVDCGRDSSVIDPADGAAVASIPRSDTAGYDGLVRVQMTRFGIRAREVASRAAPAAGEGEVQWEIHLRGNRILGVDDQHLYWSDPGDALVAYRLSDGALAWRTDIRTQRVAIGPWGLLAVTSRDEIARIDPATGAKTVSIRTDARLAFAEPIGVVDGVLLVLEAEQGLYGLDAVTGAVRWVVPVVAARQAVLSGRFVALEDDGRLSIVSATDGFTRGAFERATTLMGVSDTHMAWIEGANTLVIQPLP